jgi:hypothetical protein
MSERACRHCGRVTWSSHSPYCLQHRPSQEVRVRQAEKSRASRGYGSVHKAVRARYAALVEAGEAVCARCGLPIPAGTPFDLDHSPGRRGYLGVSHRTCNRGAGGKNGAAVTNARRRPSESKYVRHWSRVWAWPIPPDTYIDPEVVRKYLEEEARCGGVS